MSAEWLVVEVEEAPVASTSTNDDALDAFSKYHVHVHRYRGSAVPGPTRERLGCGGCTPGLRDKPICRQCLQQRLARTTSRTRCALGILYRLNHETAKERRYHYTLGAGEVLLQYTIDNSLHTCEADASDVVEVWAESICTGMAAAAAAAEGTPADSRAEA
jgi:hypothetical protein